MTRVGITTLATVTRDGAEWAVRRYDVRGAVDVPADAMRARVHGADALVWTEAPHAVDPHCPVCMSAAPCVQGLTLYPESGGLVVEHEHGSAQEMN